MLRPTKHSHPDRTVIHMSFLLLKRLRVCRIEEFHSLLQYAKKAVVGGDMLFLPALNFLYLVGVIEYRPKTDAVEYVGSNETI
jgi:hypothetical protein